MGLDTIIRSGRPFLVDSHTFYLNVYLYNLRVTSQMLGNCFMAKTKTGKGKREFNEGILNPILIEGPNASYTLEINYPFPFLNYVGKYSESLSGVENLAEQLIDFFKSGRTVNTFSPTTIGGIAESAAGIVLERNNHKLLQRPIRFHLVDFFSLREATNKEGKKLSGYLAVVESKGQLEEGDPEDNIREFAFDFLNQTKDYRYVTRLPFKGFLVSSLIKNKSSLEIVALRFDFPFDTKGPIVDPALFISPPSTFPTQDSDFRFNVNNKNYDLRDFKDPLDFYKLESEIYGHNLRKALELGDTLLSTFFFGGYLESFSPKAVSEIREKIPPGLKKTLKKYGEKGKDFLQRILLPKGTFRTAELEELSKEVDYEEIERKLRLKRTGLSLRENPELLPLVYSSSTTRSFKKKYLY